MIDPRQTQHGTATSRRGFLGAAALGSAALGSFVHADEAEPRKLKLGVIGVGWYGMVDAKAALASGGAEVAAVCDVDSEHLARSIEEIEKLQGARPRGFKRYQELLDVPGLDAVIIATPPQWHALQFLDALKKGLDIYCEKPLAYDVREGQAMVAAAKASDRIVQIGLQRRQSRAFAAVKELIDAGELGRVVQVDVQIHFRAGTADPTPQAPPESLDWDLWCGPAPKIPYSPQVGHRRWRLEKTTGHGHLVDWGIHNVDAARTVLGLGTPRAVTAAGGLYQYAGIITTPDTLTVHFEFDRCPVVWRHRLWGAQEYAPEVNNGVFFFGEKGTVFASDSRYVVIRSPKDREEFELPAPLGPDHMADFLDAVRTRKQPTCGVEEGFRATLAVQLGMIAYETASTVPWDDDEQIVGNPPAEKLLKRHYRAPYQHPWQG